MIDSDFYDTLKNKYPQIYKAIRNYVVKNKINSKKKTGRFIEVLDFILNDIRFLVKIISDAKRAYPVTEEKYKRIKNSKIFKSCIDSLKEIIKKNDMDRIHIGLCNHYLFENLKYTDKLVFITIDKNDFIKHNNKEKIEKIIKNLIIDTLPSLDVENIIL